MFKKLLSLLSLSILATTPMAVVSCSNDKLSYNLTKSDMSIIANISENLNNFSIKKETLLKDVFTKLDEQKEIIFNKFKEVTKENYIEKEFDKKKQEFDKLEISIVYFNKQYDVSNDPTWTYGWNSYNKNSDHFNDENFPEWLNLTLEAFSIDRRGNKWETDNFDVIKENMTIILGDIDIGWDDEDRSNAWIDGIKVNTKFE